MEIDLDTKLYNDYFNGKKDAFEPLYNKYKGKIVYFIYNIVKDYQKSEDIAQETFIYIMQHNMKENISFKYYIYLVARSKALNYINVEHRRSEIADKYIINNSDEIEKDVLEIITQEETKKEILESIENLDNKYKNAVYLVNIEGLSYQETADILGETLQNTKTLVYRGKKQLRKILLKKGFNDMKKVSKVFIILLCSVAILTGIVYAGTRIYNELIKKQDEVKSRGLFDLGDGITNYEIDLMANDMTWNEKSKLYHRLINNAQDYEKYKSRISQFPEASDINFDENFIVIIANENIRQPHEIDMAIYNITADENTTHIIMKQKENPNYNADSNIWYAVVDKSLYRENADVIIEQRNNNSAEFKNINDIPDNYSKEEAIQDGCIVLENNKLVSNNIEKLDEFVEDTNNGINSFIRICRMYSGNLNGERVIIDTEFKDGIYYKTDYSLDNRNKKYYHSYTKKLEKKEVPKLGINYGWIGNGEHDGGGTLITIQK